MRPPCRAARREKGVAAIELALIMTFFIGLLPFVLLFGRAFLVYTALQKSVHDAARYMATLPLAQMANGDESEETLRRYGLVELIPGQAVLVRYGPGPKGLMAAEIHPDMPLPGNMAH